MTKTISALIAGLIFGVGLCVSEMVNPAKVRSFLNIFGAWDPSLILVMGGALGVTAIGYRLVWRRTRPWMDDRFFLPPAKPIDRGLVSGAIVFGIGWGLVGLCPGPALAALSFGGLEVLVFAAAMLGGMGFYEIADKRPISERAKPHDI